jgi:hypothetical protein
MKNKEQAVVNDINHLITTDKQEFDLLDAILSQCEKRSVKLSIPETDVVIHNGEIT